jgi:hypothetical protein
MAATRIRAEDVVGIGIAVAAHVALFAWLIFARAPEPPPLPPKVTVTLQGPVAAEAGSPSREEATAAQAPTLSEEPAPPVEAAPAPPQPQQSAVRPEPPRPAPKALPTPPRPQPIPRAAAPAPAPQPRAQPRPVTPPAKASPPQQRQSRVGSDFLPARPSRVGKDFLPPASQRTGGASRIGKDFLPGAAAGNGKAATPPGPSITPQVRSSLASEVARQLKPRWQAPSGLDVDLLATTVEWDLNRDGSLSGAPRVTGQTGVNAANRSQADRHKEQALRAVRLAAPFRLPPQFYAGWQRLRFTFDRKLSQ